MDPKATDKAVIKRTDRVVDGSIEETRVMIREALERRRQGITYDLAQRFFGFFENNAPASDDEASSTDVDWNKIESLSQLRSAVGGRFKNLKEKWVNSGFPLRQHRGDRALEAELNESGWLELSVWINKQGYETRLAQPSDPWIFEVRKISQDEQSD